MLNREDASSASCSAVDPDTEHPLFTYMDIAHSAEHGTQARTHVYALTTHPDRLAQPRFVAHQDEWRNPPEMGGSDSQDAGLHVTTGTHKTCLAPTYGRPLMNLMPRLTSFFQRQGKEVSEKIVLL
jgi:hypothetical protein